MPILGRATLKRYFETGKSLTNQALAATMDSFANLSDTTAQEFVSEIIIGSVAATNVSAGEANITQSLAASGAALTGLVRHGTSGQQGAPVISQQATVAATATTQIALLPDSAHIVGLNVQVLRASSGAGGGTQFLVGNGAVIDYFGTITVSAAGNYRLTNVCARRLQNVSGAVYAAGVTATANSTFVGVVEYYPVTAAPAGAAAGTQLVEVSVLGSAIGNMNDGGVTVSAAFDGVTDQSNGLSATVNSARGFVGQAWGASKKIGQFAVWDPNNEGWHSNANVESIRLYGNTSNDITTATMLASVAASYIVPTVVVTVQQSDINTTNAYPYHWVAVSGGGTTGTTYIAEVKFWELI